VESWLTLIVCQSTVQEALCGMDLRAKKQS